MGGLLKVTQHGTSATHHFVAHDGNGNVVALVNGADGTETARYEYGPFGELIRATGPLALANPFRFSTKFQDDETGLLYYGYRFTIRAPGGGQTETPSTNLGSSCWPLVEVRSTWTRRRVFTPLSGTIP
ncbi:MAG: hypothetical protein NZM29_08945 [Nitrospira sp.]|nr:hypothetical protein [Nitrospira sp.]